MAVNELALLQQYARTRDAFAFRQLVEQHQDMVFAACHRVLGNRADAEDAAQNCFLKLSLAAGRLKAPIGGWLHTVAVHGAIDMLRGETARRARERAAAKAAPRTCTCPDASWADVRGEVDAAITALPERLRTPLVLYFLEGRTQADVATELGVSRPSVSRYLRRGVEALRRRLKRAGVMASVVALPTMLSSSAAEAAPATLAADLGKIALAGTGAKATAVTAGGTFAALKMSAVIVVAVGAGAGAVAVHHAASPRLPLPVSAAAPTPLVKQEVPLVPLTATTVLNAELTLPPKPIQLGTLGRLLKEQLGVHLACRPQAAKEYVRPGPGKHTVRDVLAATAAAAPLTAEILADGDRVVVCFWQKPDVQALAEMTVLARSDDALKRATAAHWLELVAGRDALVQLLKMLADPD